MANLNKILSNTMCIVKKDTIYNYSKKITNKSTISDLQIKKGYFNCEITF